MENDVQEPGPSSTGIIDSVVYGAATETQFAETTHICRCGQRFTDEAAYLTHVGPLAAVSPWARIMGRDRTHGCASMDALARNHQLAIIWYGRHRAMDHNRDVYDQRREQRELNQSSQDRVDRDTLVAQQHTLGTITAYLRDNHPDLLTGGNEDLAAIVIRALRPHPKGN